MTKLFNGPMKRWSNGPILLLALCLCASVADVAHAQTGTTVTGVTKTQGQQTPATAGLKVLKTVASVSVYGTVRFQACETDSAGRCVRYREVTCGGVTYLGPRLGYIKGDGTWIDEAAAAGIKQVPNSGCSPAGLATEAIIELTPSVAEPIRLPASKIVQVKVLPDQASVDWSSIAPAAAATPAASKQDQDRGKVLNSEEWTCVTPASVPNAATGAENLFCDSADSDKLKRKNSAGTVNTIEGGGGGGATTFLGLTDTPSSYTGHGLKAVRVNSGATALEFIDLATLYAALSHVHSGADITTGTVADARLSANVSLLGQTIEDAEVTSITTRAKIPAAIAYEDEANAFTALNQFKDVELDDQDATPVADRRLRTIDGLLRATDTANLEGRHISRLSLELLTDAEVAAGAAIAKSKISTTGAWTAAEIPSLDASKITTGELPDARVADNITASNYLPLAGGTMTGAIVTSAGTLSAPSLELDTQTGIYRFAASQIGISAGNVLAARFSSGGLSLPSTRDLLWCSDAACAVSIDSGLERAGAAALKVTDGSTGYGALDASAYKVSGAAFGVAHLASSTSAQLATVLSDEQPGGTAMFISVAGLADGHVPCYDGVTDNRWENCALSTEFLDSVFRVTDNADTSKKLAFELGGFTTATTRTVTPFNGASVIPEPRTCSGTDKVSAISAAGVVTCAADVSAGSPTWDSLAAPVAAVSMVSNATAETVTFDFQAAFTTGSQFLVKSSVGNPTGGTLFEILGHDPDVTVLKATGDGTNGIQLSGAGSLAAIGTGAIIATDLSCTNCIGPTEITDLTLTTDTAGNYVASVATTAPLAGGAAGSEGAALTLSITADGIGPTQVDETAAYVWSALHTFDLSTAEVMKLGGTQTANSVGRYMAFVGGSAFTTARGYLGFTETGTGTPTLFAAADADSMAFRSEGKMYFGTSGDNIAVTIDTSQNVGIGVLVPAHKLDVAGNIQAISATLAPIMAERTDAGTNTALAAARLLHTTSADMVDGLAAGLLFAVKDNTSAIEPMAAIYGRRSGADNTGRLDFYVTNAGVQTLRMTLSNLGLLSTVDVVDAATGFRIANAAASGNVLRGNGTNFVSAPLAITDLATFSSADLAGRLTDETGSGAAVFGTSPSLTTPSFSSIINTGTLTLPTSTDTLIGRATTDTLTAKTLDAEGTGNVLTTVGKIWIDAGVCQNVTAGTGWDLPTSAAAVSACRTGTNTQKGVLEFATDSGTLTAQYKLRLPADWASASNVDSLVQWNTAATANDVVWQIAIACAGDGESDDPTFTDDVFTADTAKGTANQINDTAVNTVTTTGTCAAGKIAFVRIKRDPAHASDTLAAGTVPRLLGVEITYRRAQ